MPDDKLVQVQGTPPVPVTVMPDGRQIPRVEPLIPARTSAKVAVGGGVIAAFPAVEILQWVQGLELSPAWLESATNSDYFVYYGAMLIATFIARFVKSPIENTPI